MDFEWESAKAAANVGKHGVSFEEAVSALKDNLAATARDLEHSVAEFRFITFWRLCAWAVARRFSF